MAEMTPDLNYIVYVQTDRHNRITAVNSSAFVSGDWARRLTEVTETNTTTLKVTTSRGPSTPRTASPGTSWRTAK